MNHLQRTLLFGAALCLSLSAWQGWRLVEILRWNHAIAAGRAVSSNKRAPPEVKFADAYLLAQQEKTQEALDTYRSLLKRSARPLRHNAMFNSANIYLRQALTAHSGTDASASLTLVELAKASYRELLQEDSSDWDARYNLEKALRLAPDPEQDPEAFFTPPSQLRTPPSGQGTVLGLP